MHYLFGFSGRINRAKMWLFLLVTLVWEIVVFVVAIFGLHWTQYIQAVKDFADSHAGPAPLPIPDPVSGTGWAGVGAVGLLLALYIVAYFAVALKRLHDRNKGAIWLVIFLILPSVVNIGVLTTGSTGGFPQELFVGQVGILRGVAYLVALVLGLWGFIELFFLRGTRGENDFGPDPLPPLS